MVELEHEIRGTGEPVVLVHAGICAEWFKPLMEEPALAVLGGASAQVSPVWGEPPGPAGGLAEAVAGFFARHPLTPPAQRTR
jgi:hypothetical protein